MTGQNDRNGAVLDPASTQGDRDGKGYTIHGMVDWQPILAVFLTGAGLFVSMRASDTKAEKRADKQDERLTAMRSEIRADMLTMRSEIKADFTALSARVDRVADAQSHFYNILGEHKGKIEMLEKR